MSVKIIKALMPESRYDAKSPYPMDPEFVVVHNTANDASARGEIAYMTRSDITTSFHYAVDDAEVVQGIPLNRNAWHAGDGRNGTGNRKGIAIEICHSKSGGDRFMKAEQNGAWLVAQLLMQFGWGLAKVKKHQDFMNKYCPHRTLDLGWSRFLKMIEGYMTKPEVDAQVTYTVKAGDSLSAIAKQYLGDANRFPEIVAANGISNPNIITVGQRLVIPAGTVPKEYAVYTIKKGDTFWGIAKTTLGDANLYKQLMELNPGKSEMNLQVGDKIKLPTAGSAPAASEPAGQIKVGSKVKVKPGAKTYEGKKLASFVYDNVYDVHQLSGSRAVIGQRGVVTAAMKVVDLIPQ